MKKILLIFSTLFSVCFQLQAQNVGVGTNNPKAKLDVSATDDGILIPRVSLTSTTSALPLTAPDTSEMVYNKVTVSDVTPGFYYWSGAKWVRLQGSNTPDWIKVGTTNPAVNADDQYILGKAGIGTLTPDAPLTVGDTALSTSGYMHIKRLSNPHINLFEGSTSVARIQGSKVGTHPQFQIVKANGTSPMFVVNQDDGKVGIGTTVPDRQLEVDDSSSDSAYIRIRGAEAVGAYAGLEFSHQSSGNTATKTAIVSVPFNSWKRSDLRFVLNSDANNNNYNIATAADTKMIILNGGNVGIGTLTPRGIFDVAKDGDIYLSSNTTVGSGQSLYLPGHIYLSPYNGTDIAYLQARRSNTAGNTQLEVRTTNAGTLGASVTFESDGDVQLEGDNVIHMPNNLSYLEYATTVSASGGVNTWQVMTSLSPTLKVKNGDKVVVNICFDGRFNGGSGSDDGVFKIYAVGSGGCGGVGGTERRWDDLEQFRDDFMPFSFIDVFPITCDGTYQFRLEFNDLYTDDSFQTKNVVITAVVY